MVDEDEQSQGETPVEATDQTPEPQEAPAPVSERRYPDPNHLVDGVHPYPLSQLMPPDTIG